MISVRIALPILALAWIAPALAFADPPPTLDVDLGGGARLALILVPKGTFEEGSPPGEVGRSDDELSHRVTLSNDVYIGKYPVTRGQFARFTTATGYRSEAEKGTSGGSGWDGKALVQRPDFNWKNPGFAQTDDHPVTLVTYDDALAFTAWLSRATGRAFTLPTEAQWEHAYRAGTTGAYYGAPNQTDPLGLGWFKANAGNGTRPVGQKPANALGLYDLAGNVNEWCLDWYAPYGSDLAVDPVATTPDASDKPRRVLRGGSWLKDAKSGRAAARYRNTPGSRNADNGFRVAAGTTVGAALPSAPASSPAPPGAPAKPRSSSNDAAVGGVFFGGLCFGTIGFVCLVMILALRTRKAARAAAPAAGLVRHRLGRDGFWIDAPAHLTGSLVSYRYADANRQIHDGQARIEGAPSGQYVYTGHAPVTILALQVIGFAAAPAWSGQRGVSVASEPRYPASYATPQDDTPFRGYPSAY